MVQTGHTEMILDKPSGLASSKYQHLRKLFFLTWNLLYLNVPLSNAKFKTTSNWLP